jgi:DNA-binding NtrC family response regulator
MEDIPLLIDHFIDRFNILQKKNLEGISDEAMAFLMAYRYPGNIRELANLIERAFILCKNGMIEKKHLPDFLLAADASPARKTAASFRDLEADYLINALRQNKGNRPQTARQLGIHRSTLYRKIKALKLSRAD